MIQIHVYIKGIVTGVFFRAWTKAQADTVGVTGWVKNVYDRPDMFGTEPGVEVVLQGKKILLEKMLALLKTGPSGAKVRSIKTKEEQANIHFVAFDIVQ